MAVADSTGTPARVDLPVADDRPAASNVRYLPTSDAAYRADLIRRYLAAADWARELHLLAEAVDYDRQNPGAPSLRDELLGAALGDAA